MLQVLIQPILTEKSLREASSGRYTFLVIRKCTKTNIKAAIESAFKVNVVGVNTAIIPGKSSRSRTGHTTTTPATKKAIVFLKSGQTLDVFTKVASSQKS